MRFPHHPGGGFAAFGTIASDVIAGLFFILCFAVVVGLIVLIVRFLLVATKAAELYVAKNSVSTTPVATSSTADSAAAVTPATTVASAPVSATMTAPTPTKPAPRTRTPKAPPAV